MTMGGTIGGSCRLGRLRGRYRCDRIAYASIPYRRYAHHHATMSLTMILLPNDVQTMTHRIAAEALS